MRPDPATLLRCACHESGHAITALDLGVPVRDVTLRSPDGVGSHTTVAETGDPWIDATILAAGIAATGTTDGAGGEGGDIEQIVRLLGGRIWIVGDDHRLDPQASAGYREALRRAELIIARRRPLLLRLGEAIRDHGHLSAQQIHRVARGQTVWP